jgi:2,3-bisphosphoglycerate-dependent phosphoglycerate mutase
VLSTGDCFVALMRHGTFIQPADVPSGHLPHGLTDEGRSEAERGARMLFQLADDNDLTIAPIIDCSRMRRAYETAAIVRSVLSERSGKQFEIVEFEDLAERSLGAAANLTVTEIERIVAEDPRYSPLPKGWKRSPEIVLPFQGAESLLTAGYRVAAHLQSRTRDLAPNTLKILVGHGGAFRHAAHALGILRLEQLSSLSMYCGEAVTLRHGPQGWSHFAGRWKPRKSVTTSSEQGVRT